MAGLLNSLFSLRLSNVLTTVPSRSHRGYLPFEGRLPNIESEEKQLKLQTKAINLKPVKRIHFKVDPLHHRARSIRQVSFGIGAKTSTYVCIMGWVSSKVLPCHLCIELHFNFLMQFYFLL